MAGVQEKEGCGDFKLGRSSVKSDAYSQVIAKTCPNLHHTKGNKAGQ